MQITSKNGRISRLIVLMMAGMLIMLSNCTKKSTFYESGDDFVNEVIETVESVSPEMAKSMMDTASFYILLDVREPNEHHPGYIPGSINIPRGTLEFNMNKPEYWESKSMYAPYKSDLIFVYCKKGQRSVLAASTLEKMGYTNVKYLEGGFKEWELTYPNDYQRDEIDTGHAGEAEEVGGC
jgi:rhodanese-related sulfurtransferase